jgi:hypothetical protein
MAGTTYLSVITLNVNDFNTPIKRHKSIELKKHDLTIAYKERTSLAKTNIGLEQNNEKDFLSI